MRLGKTYSGTSIAEDTTKLEHNIPATLRFLNMVKADLEPMHRTTAANIQREFQSLNPAHSEYQDEMAELMADLENLMNDICPDNTYFGNHPDDGANLGIWEVEAA